MALDRNATAAIALHRFGCGPRPGSIAAIASDPRGALLAELDKPGVARIADGGLMSSGAAARAFFEFRAERRAKQIVAQREAERRRAMTGSGAETSMADNAAGDAKADAKPAEAPPGSARRIILDEANARLHAALTAEIGFAERLVWFWSNHFCVSADKVPSMVGAYEREAIRPHALGRFADMLLAAEGHPAMLFYLDNAASIGPGSIAGINRDKGLNENLAREIMELHTLGVRTGYTQDDVTRFAKVLTGWTFFQTGNPERGGEFVFMPRMHEPGGQTIMGKSYSGNGIDQGRAVLADLARHPATAAHAARKLAVHFVADEPPQPLVQRLERTFRDSDGDLKEVARALVAAPEAWDAPRNKLKRPDEWLVSGLRAAGAVEFKPERLLRAQALLGQPLWRPPAPQGFSDQEEAWLDGLPTRLDIANAFAARDVNRFDPNAMLDDALGPLASHETRETVRRAESRQQAFALLAMSPEFQRR